MGQQDLSGGCATATAAAAAAAAVAVNWGQSELEQFPKNWSLS